MSGDFFIIADTKQSVRRFRGGEALCDSQRGVSRTGTVGAALNKAEPVTWFWGLWLFTALGWCLL